MSRGGLVSVLALIGLAGACGNMTVGPDPDVVFPELSVCVPGWQIVQELGIQSTAPATLAITGGELYLPLWGSDQIVAVPTAGGTPRIVVDSAAYKTWIEGDQLTYAILDDKFWRVPLAGGAPVLVGDGQTTFAGPSYPFVTDVALDETSYYWDLWPQSGAPRWDVWRLPRAGGAATQLATLPLPTPLNAWRTLTAVPGGVMVAVNGDAAAAYFVPLDGGSVRTLAAPPAPPARGTNFLVGTGPAGVLWTREIWPDGRWPATEMMFSDALDPSASAVRPFWPDKPAAMRPAGGVPASWPDGAGGWIVTGTEWFSDLLTHQTVWEVDAHGNARRLGCNPIGRWGSTSAVAVTADAVYLASGIENDRSSYDDYSIVKLAR